MGNSITGVFEINNPGFESSVFSWVDRVEPEAVTVAFGDRVGLSHALEILEGLYEMQVHVRIKRRDGTDDFSLRITEDKVLLKAPDLREVDDL